MHDDELIKEKYSLLLPHLDEKSRRLYMASECVGLDRGGISKTAKLSGFSRVTLTAGIKELRESVVSEAKNKYIRKSGAGRKKQLIKLQV